MAETITIPSSSLYLNAPEPSSTQPSVKKVASRLQQTSPKDRNKALDNGGVTKRKQSKSRNGCITCKAKRLKCDETKPSCQQCARRSVTCGGYKKDFKWRPFEETNFTGKPHGKARKVSPPLTSAHSKVESPADSDNSRRDILSNILDNDAIYHAYFAPPQSPRASIQGLHSSSSFIDASYPSVNNEYDSSQAPPYMMQPPNVIPIDQSASSTIESSNTGLDVDSVGSRCARTTAPSSVSSGQSPRPVDLLSPGPDLSIPQEEYPCSRSQHPESFYQPSGFTPPTEPDEMDEVGVEEIPRSFNPDYEPWSLRMLSPSPSTSSNSSADSNNFPLLLQPQFAASSPETLTRRFDRDTCGILSLKDGPTENPWRTLIWPLARDCPALYHAIASMTFFHQSDNSRALRIQGIDHMQTSIHALASNLENMRVDAAISTTLALAFSESWDQHIKTGIDHIKGAKLLIDKALVQHSQAPLQSDEFSRLKFLCNTWIYMDVIARLTSADNDESNDFDLVYDAIYMNGAADTQLDPLMGCARTLFPIIGKVANLVRKVRRANSNGPTIISQAMKLKSQLEGWVAPTFIDAPEDETTKPHDFIKTAIAYQYATLLYLHQAVPEIPSLPSAVLAKKVLCELATVEPGSRALIVHLFPLIAAGCEVTDQEDRDWVKSRWETMATRMRLGPIERCSDVTREVWRLRDEYAAVNASYEPIPNDNANLAFPSLKREFSSASEDYDFNDPYMWVEGGGERSALSVESPLDPPGPTIVKSDRIDGKKWIDMGTELLEPAFTVKGRLHWLGVMKFWGWEVLLG